MTGNLEKFEEAMNAFQVSMAMDDFKSAEAHLMEAFQDIPTPWVLPELQRQLEIVRPRVIELRAVENAKPRHWSIAWMWRRA